MASVVVGGHYGDEGKGKIVSYLAVNDNPAVIARAGVGPNAGHTVYRDGKKFGLRMIPCGFVNENSRLCIGAGVLVDVDRFLKEVDETGVGNRIVLDERCAVIEEEHKRLDLSDNSKKIGTTGSGCGPANAARVNRTAKQAREIPELSDFVGDVPSVVNEAVSAKKEVLVEASQGFGLSLYYGNYPYVTSKDTSASSACADVGLGPTNVDDVIVVFKAYMSRVGEDPYINYLSDDDVEKNPLWKKILGRAEDAGVEGENANEKIAFYFGEKGTVTGRPRKIGVFDYKLARYSSMVNGATQIALTCLDRMFPDCAKARSLEKLSGEAKEFVASVEEGIGVKVSLVSTGPDAKDLIDLRKT